MQDLMLFHPLFTQLIESLNNKFGLLGSNLAVNDSMQDRMHKRADNLPIDLLRIGGHLSHSPNFFKLRVQIHNMGDPRIEFFNIPALVPVRGNP